MINGKTVAPGTYTMFIDLKPNNWTLIVSNWKAQTRYDPKNTAEIWGAYGYTPDKDVVRAPMTLGTLPFSVEQLTWDFTDMSDAGGKLTIMWDKVVASVPFKLSEPIRPALVAPPRSNTLLQDLRHSLRLLRRTPAFTAVAVRRARARHRCQHGGLLRRQRAGAAAAAGTHRSRRRRLQPRPGEARRLPRFLLSGLRRSSRAQRRRSTS